MCSIVHRRIQSYKVDRPRWNAISERVDKDYATTPPKLTSSSESSIHLALASCRRSTKEKSRRFKRNLRLSVRELCSLNLRLRRVPPRGYHPCRCSKHGHGLSG